MSFRKIRVYKKRVHSITATEILDRLDRYVNQNDAEPIRLLVTHWKDQQDALSYREIREAILNGDFDGSLAKEWTDDYSRFVSEKMVPVWRNAMVAGSFGQPIADKLSGKFRFDVSKPTVLNWIDERGAMFVRSVTDQQKEAMRGLIRQYAYEKYSVDELARVIRPCVGLTDAQSRSVMRYYDTMKANMREQHPRMKASNIRDRCREKTMVYAERMHRRRAYLIAQTEMAYAYNHGMHESMRQAMEQGFMGTMEKRWITSGDLNVCPECDALNGVQIGFDDSFDFGKHQILFTGMGLTPPLHPRCGCAVEYIEVSPPVFGPEPEIGGEEPISFSNGDEAYQFFGSKPDLSIRRQNREEYNRLKDEYRNRTQYGSWEQTLTDAEYMAIRNYTGPDYSGINGLLRHEMTKNQVDMWNSTCNTPVQDMIDSITSALSRFELKSDILVYKTCEDDVLQNLSLDVGSTFHDSGFGSTSVTMGKKAGGNIFMEITVPKGKGVGAWVNPLNPYEGSDRDEYEFLLNRGTEYEVTGIETNGEDTVVKLRVIGRKETGWSYATKEEVIDQWKAKGIYNEESAKLL